MAQTQIIKVSRIVVFGILIMSFMSACTKTPLESEEDSPKDPIWKLDKNRDGLIDLANACMKADSIAIFNITYNPDRSVLYWLSMKEGGDVELYSEIVSEEVQVPELSMDYDDGVFYWILNGTYLVGMDGNRIAVTDLSSPISFVLYDDVIRCLVNDTIIGEYPTTKSAYLAKDVAIDFDLENGVFNFHLSSGYTAKLPAISGYEILKCDVLNQSYYKDVFLDAGVGLSSMKSLDAAKYLGLSLEGICFPYSGASTGEQDTQREIISGNSMDTNGRLLYPDGQPRFKMLFVIGGDSKRHGQSLGKEGLKRMRSFVGNGGCYVGTCAGAFLASNGYDGNKNYAYYLSVWPGMMIHTGLKNTYTGMFIETESPLLKYYDYGGDHYIDSLRHNLGGYAKDTPNGTEVLARFDYPSKKAVHQSSGVWAYKESQHSGRIVLTGSHPEVVSSGERRDLAAAMIQYALDGRGITSLKGFLKNGEKREMTKKTEDEDPAYTRIGDLQTHHFATYIPSGAKNIQVEVSSPSKCDLALMMNHGSYAFSSSAEYTSSQSGSKQQLIFPSIREGFWFIAVQCLTTVTVKETVYGQEYGGNLEVLNGIPYRISICWE